MRIVHIATVPETLDYFLRGHIRYAVSRGADIHLVSSAGQILDRVAASESVTAHAIEMTRRISPLRDLQSLTSLTRRLRSIQPTVVHAHTPKAGLLGMLASALAGVPVRVYHLHGLPMMTVDGWKRQLLGQCDRIACRLAHRVYCVSPSLRHVVDQERLCPAARLRMLENGSICGVDATNEFNPARAGETTRGRQRRQMGIPDGALVVGFVGRIGREKGIHELTWAWTQLRREFDDAHLLLVGPIEQQHATSCEVLRQLKEDPRVHIAGRVEQTARYYAAMDVLAFPTHREGFGQVAIEGSAMSLPVVASHVTGCVDAVQDGVTGTLIPARCSHSLAQAIRRYLSDEPLRKEHGRRGRQFVLERFEPSRLWRALWREYQELLTVRGVTSSHDTGPLPVARKAA